MSTKTSLSASLSLHGSVTKLTIQRRYGCKGRFNVSAALRRKSQKAETGAQRAFLKFDGAARHFAKLVDNTSAKLTVQSVFGVNSQTTNFLIYHVVPGVPFTIPAGEYRLHIQVVGHNVPSVTRVVHIWQDDAHHPQLALIE